MKFGDGPDELSLADCCVPDRCDHGRTCQVCEHPVHYDPKASIPQLGAELVVCTACIDQALAP
jgi:hypothetical protein